MVARPRLLDLYCCAGGAAMGYHRAGFEVVGVDIEPQPRYPFEFHQADALTYPLEGFVVVHASPPCQKYSVTSHLWDRDHPDLIDATRQRLIDSGLPYVIENVVGAPLNDPITMCGSGLAMRVRRHRLFESNVTIRSAGCRHTWQNSDRIFPAEWSRSGREGSTGIVTVYGDGGAGPGSAPEEARRAAMGIDWMNRRELSEAIPPAFTEYIGDQLIRSVRPQCV